MNKPKILVDLNGPDGNIFALLARASHAIKNNEKAKEMQQAVYGCGSYEKAIEVIEKYVEIIQK